MIIRRRMPTVASRRRPIGSIGRRLLRQSISRIRRIVVSRLPAPSAPLEPPYLDEGYASPEPDFFQTPEDATSYAAYAAYPDSAWTPGDYPLRPPASAPQTVRRSASSSPAKPEESEKMPADLQAIFNLHKGLGHITNESFLDKVEEARPTPPPKQVQRAPVVGRREPPPQRPVTPRNAPPQPRAETPLESEPPAPASAAPPLRPVRSKVEYLGVRSGSADAPLMASPSESSAEDSGNEEDETGEFSEAITAAESPPTHHAPAAPPEIPPDDLPDAMLGAYETLMEEDSASIDPFTSAEPASPATRQVQRSKGEDEALAAAIAKAEGISDPGRRLKSTAMPAKSSEEDWSADSAAATASFAQTAGLANVTPPSIAAQQDQPTLVDMPIGQRSDEPGGLAGRSLDSPPAEPQTTATSPEGTMTAMQRQQTPPPDSDEIARAIAQAEAVPSRESAPPVPSSLTPQAKPPKRVVRPQAIQREREVHSPAVAENPAQATVRARPAPTAPDRETPPPQTITPAPQASVKGRPQTTEEVRRSATAGAPLAAPLPTSVARQEARPTAPGADDEAERQAAPPSEIAAQGIAGQPDAAWPPVDLKEQPSNRASRQAEVSTPAVNPPDADSPSAYSAERPQPPTGKEQRVIQAEPVQTEAEPKGERAVYPGSPAPVTVAGKPLVGEQPIQPARAAASGEGRPSPVQAGRSPSGESSSLDSAGFFAESEVDLEAMPGESSLPRQPIDLAEALLGPESEAWAGDSSPLDRRTHLVGLPPVLMPPIGRARPVASLAPQTTTPGESSAEIGQDFAKTAASSEPAATPTPPGQRPSGVQRSSDTTDPASSGAAASDDPTARAITQAETIQLSPDTPDRASFGAAVLDDPTTRAITQAETIQRLPDTSPATAVERDLLGLLNLPPNTPVRRDWTPMPPVNVAPDSQGDGSPGLVGTATPSLQAAREESPSLTASDEDERGKDETGAKDEGAEVEKMAREVYRILQRRLKVERERSSGHNR